MDPLEQVEVEAEGVRHERLDDVAVRAHQEAGVRAVLGRDPRVPVVHGDIVKSIVADALGLHLDLFQRIHVDPCSVTAIRYTRLRPFLLRLGDTGDFAGFAPREHPGGGGAAEVGGGAGAP